MPTSGDSPQDPRVLSRNARKRENEPVSGHASDDSNHPFADRRNEHTAHGNHRFLLDPGLGSFRHGPSSNHIYDKHDHHPASGAGLRRSKAL